MHGIMCLYQPYAFTCWIPVLLLRLPCWCVGAGCSAGFAGVCMARLTFGMHHHAGIEALPQPQRLAAEARALAVACALLRWSRMGPAASETASGASLQELQLAEVAYDAQLSSAAGLGTDPVALQVHGLFKAVQDAALQSRQ